MQRPWADAYLAAWDQPRAPRIGLSRFVFPARDRKTALDQIGADVHAAAQRFALRGAFPAGLGQEEALRRFHSFYGHPDEVIAALRQERVLPVATDLITQFNPAVPDHDAAIRALELIATEVAPALGWKPSTAVGFLRRRSSPRVVGIAGGPIGITAASPVGSSARAELPAFTDACARC